MSAIATLLREEEDRLGGWVGRVLPRSNTPWPTTQEMRARWRGQSYKPIRHRPKLSPTQAAKVRWKRNRNRRRDDLLWSREFKRRDTLGAMMRLLQKDNAPCELSWFERDPTK